MSHSTQFPGSVLLMLPSDTYKEGTPNNTDASFDPNGLSPWEDSPLINCQLEVSNVSSGTSSSQSTSQFDFEDLPTWTLLPDGGNVTSPTGDSANEGDEQQVHDDSDIDKKPRKRQKTQSESATRNERIKISNLLLVKSRNKRSTLFDGRSRKPRLPSPSPTTVIKAKRALSQDPSAKDKDEIFISTHTRKRTNGSSGLLIPRPMAMSNSASTSDSLDSGALKDREEPPKRTRGLALRPTNNSYVAKSKKPRDRTVDQGELELLTNADVARVTFRKPDKLRLHGELEEDDTKRNVGHILTSLMEMEDVARNESPMTNGVQNQVAMPGSSIYTRCDNLVEEIFGPGRRLLKAKKGLLKKQFVEKSRASSDTDLPIVTHSKVAITNIQQDDEIEIPSSSADQDSEMDGPEMDEPKLLETSSKGIKNIQPVDEPGVAVTSDIEREQVENKVQKHCLSIDGKDQEDEKTKHDANSLQVPPPQLENWSTTLRSLIKGKKRFQHQDLTDLKDTLQEIYNNRSNISATTSLAQEVYQVAQLGAHDVPNDDELGLRALARRSTRYWGIREIDA